MAVHTPLYYREGKQWALGTSGFLGSAMEAVGSLLWKLCLCLFSLPAWRYLVCFVKDKVILSSGANKDFKCKHSPDFCLQGRCVLWPQVISEQRKVTHFSPRDRSNIRKGRGLTSKINVSVGILANMASN